MAEASTGAELRRDRVPFDLAGPPWSTFNRQRHVAVVAEGSDWTDIALRGTFKFAMEARSAPLRFSIVNFGTVRALGALVRESLNAVFSRLTIMVTELSSRSRRIFQIVNVPVLGTDGSISAFLRRCEVPIDVRRLHSAFRAEKAGRAGMHIVTVEEFISIQSLRPIWTVVPCRALLDLSESPRVTILAQVSFRASFFKL